MEYDRAQKDEKGLETATIMRDDFQGLADKIATEDYVLSKSDAAKLLVGAMIQVNQTQTRINNLKLAMTGYQTDLIPKLQAIVDAENDEAASKLAEEKFLIKNDN
jgi:hypothetical protein